MSPPSSPPRPLRLAGTSSILVSGPDARDFLQGQLSADLASLSTQQALLGSCNSPQGRVQAVVWMVERTDGIALLLPSSMVDTTLARLRKYLLRSKAKIERGADRLNLGLLDHSALPSGVALTSDRGHAEHDGTSYIRLPGHGPALTLGAGPVGDPDIAVELQWRLDDIRAGLPQVYPQTHEAFVAQMLNLDVLGGISFGKGCYTGQEIIARTHYRGTIKRRMFRYVAAGAPPAPGERIVADDQHAGDVVDAAPTNAGCELLAVVNVAQATSGVRLSLPSGTDLIPAPLPYPV